MCFKAEKYTQDVQTWDLLKLRREEFLTPRQQLCADASGYDALDEADAHRKRLAVLQAEVRRRGLLTRKTEGRDHEAAIGSALLGGMLGGAMKGTGTVASVVAEGVSGAAVEGMDYRKARRYDKLAAANDAANSVGIESERLVLFAYLLPAGFKESNAPHVCCLLPPL